MSDNKALLEKGNEAIRRGDYEGFLTLCADNTEWTFVGDGCHPELQAVAIKDDILKYFGCNMAK